MLYNEFTELLEVVNCCRIVRLQFDQVFATANAVRVQESSPLAVVVLANKQDVLRIVLFTAAADAAMVEAQLKSLSVLSE